MGYMEFLLFPPKNNNTDNIVQHNSIIQSENAKNADSSCLITDNNSISNELTTLISHNIAKKSGVALNIESDVVDSETMFKYLPEWIVEVAKKMQVNNLSEIQLKTLPLILSGNNVIASSPTGTGKTICFCWPILTDLSRNTFGVFALVLTPTRELALQVAEQFTLYGSPIGASVLTVIGGTDLVSESASLSFRPNIVVATPGRLSFQLKTPGRNIAEIFSETKYLVLDEADNLLSSAFEEDLITIISSLLPMDKGRKTLLFSATINESIESMEKMFKLAKVPVKLVNITGAITNNISHYYLFYPQCIHLVHLNYILKLPQFLNKNGESGVKKEPRQGIIFVATKKRCILIEDSLKLLGFTAVGLHSLMNQRDRTRQLDKFRNRKVELLVATNVASRGLDIPKVSFVVNLDICLDVKDYTHRVGRTGRACEKGIALNFVDERDVSKVESFEKGLGLKLNQFEFSEMESLKSLNKVTRASQRALVSTEMTLKHKYKVDK